MEGIGRVRKVKSKIQDGVETIVEKSKSKIESLRDDSAEDEQNNNPKLDEKVDTIGEGLKNVGLEGK